MTKVWDCFTFFNEIDLLRMRLAELSNVIHRFVIVESTVTFSGNPKPLYFREHRDLFHPWLDRIEHVIVTDTPETTNAWDREMFQRNAITRGLSEAEPSDLIMVSDLDEIPRNTAIAALRKREEDWIALRMPVFYLKMNYANVKGHPHNPTAIAIRAKRFVSPEDTRHSRLRPLAQHFKGNGQILGFVADHAGWHFSYLGDIAAIRNKIASFSHQEFNSPEIMNSIDVDAIIERGGDLFGRAGFDWAVVDFDDYFSMRLVRQEPERFQKYVIPGAVLRIDPNTGGDQLALKPI